MRKNFISKVVASVLASAMVLGLAACGSNSSKPDGNASTPASNTASVSASASEPVSDPVEPYTVKTGADGQPLNFNGLEVTIRNWWSPADGSESEPTSEYDEAVLEYHTWLQKKYNFTLKTVGMGDWGSTPDDFVKYVQTGGDENNYIFVERNAAPMLQAFLTGMCADYNALGVIDFNEDKYQINRAHEMNSLGDHIYGIAAGYVQPKHALFFNKQVLADVGITADMLYDWQKNGEWTWDKFDEVCAKVQRDTDGDGADDIFGLTTNEGAEYEAWLESDGGAIIKKDADGKFRLGLEDADTMKAFEKYVELMGKYDNHDPAEIADRDNAWEYYKEEFLSGKVAFLGEEYYAGTAGAYLDVDDRSFDIGLLMYPKGPDVEFNRSVFNDNFYCIPSCYDEQKQKDLATILDLWLTQPNGYEDYNAQIANARAGIFDERAISETVVFMSDPKNGYHRYRVLIPTICENNTAAGDLGWPNWYTTPSSAIEGVKESWQTYIDEANNIR